MQLVDKLQKVYEASGNHKIEVLRTYADDPLLRKVLLYTYDPFKRFGITSIKPTRIGNATFETVSDNIFILLDDMSSGILSGQVAKQACQLILDLMRCNDGQIFQRILKKDIRVGVSAITINKAIPGLVPVFEVMRAKTFDPAAAFSEPMYVSVKLDGLRGYVKPYGSVYTRNGHKIQGVDHIMEALKPYSHMAFDGELMVPGLEFNAASGQIRSHDESKDAVYHIFDLPETGLPFSQRYIELKKVITEINSPFIKLVKHVRIDDRAKVDELFAKALGAGYEGLVLKTMHHKYQMKRSSDWLKLKPVKDEDVRIVGFYEGEGKYVSMLGGVLVDRPNGVTAKVGGGFSDAQRAKIWNNQEVYSGQMIEVHYFEDTPSGDYRHARFKKFRGDKG